jgi:hypothetical protein
MTGQTLIVPFTEIEPARDGSWQVTWTGAGVVAPAVTLNVAESSRTCCRR